MKNLSAMDMTNVNGGGLLSLAVKAATTYVIADSLDNYELDGSFMKLNTLWR